MQKSNRLNRVSKENYFKTYFETNKRDSKKYGKVQKLSSVLKHLKKDLTNSTYSKYCQQNNIRWLHYC